jgi:hypothetical protein
VLFTCFTKTVNAEFPTVQPGGVIRCHIPELPLAPGTYTINIICKQTRSQILDKIEGAAEISVTSGNFFGTGRVTPPDCGSFMVKHHWKLLPRDESLLSRGVKQVSEPLSKSL